MDNDILTAEIECLRTELAKYKEAEKDGRLVRLPYGVGETVYIVMDCERILMYPDWETGDDECPFEDQCSYEDCEDVKKQVFETKIEYYWLSQGRKGIELRIDVEGIHSDLICLNDIFKTREEAEAALEKEAQE